MRRTRPATSAKVMKAPRGASNRAPGKGTPSRSAPTRLALIGVALAVLLIAPPALIGARASANPAVDTILTTMAPALGNEPASRLRMKFEVTFMKIDVANLEARLAATTAARIEPLTRVARSEEREREIAQALLDPAEPILLSNTYLRESDYGRLERGIRVSMEEAERSGAIDAEEREVATATLLEMTAPLVESGVAKGGVFASHIDGDVVRSVYIAPDGTVVFDEARTDATLGRALRASWFGKESRFREKLVRSLWEGR